MIDIFVKRPKEFFPPSFLCLLSHSQGLLLSSALAFLPLRFVHCCLYTDG